MNNYADIITELSNLRRIKLCKGKNARIKRALITEKIFQKTAPPSDILQQYIRRITTILTPTALYWTELETDIENNFSNVTIDNEAQNIISQALAITKDPEITSLLLTNKCSRPEDKATVFLLSAALEALKDADPEQALTLVENNLIEPYRGDYARTPLTFETDHDILSNTSPVELETKLREITNILVREIGESNSVAILNPRIRTRENASKQITIIYYTKTKDLEKTIIENGRVAKISIPIIRKTTIIIISEKDKTTGYVLYSGKLTTLQRKVYEKILEALGLPTRILTDKTLRKELDPKLILTEAIQKGEKEPHSLLKYITKNLRKKINKHLDKTNDNDLQKLLQNIKAAKLSLSDTRGRHISFSLVISHEEYEETELETIAHTAASKHDIIDVILDSLEEGAENPVIVIGLLSKYKDRKVKLDLINKKGTIFYTHNLPKHLVHELHKVLGE